MAGMEPTNPASPVDMWRPYHGPLARRRLPEDRYGGGRAHPGDRLRWNDGLTRYIDGGGEGSRSVAFADRRNEVERQPVHRPEHQPKRRRPLACAPIAPWVHARVQLRDAQAEAAGDPFRDLSQDSGAEGEIGNAATRGEK